MTTNLPKAAKEPLITDLLLFYDDFVEFHDYCSFLCDAFACLAAEEDYLDTSTVMGASRYCHWMKHRIQELKIDLSLIYEKAYTQSEIQKKAHNPYMTEPVKEQ